MSEHPDADGRRCFWCGSVATDTADHVFPRCLFPAPMPDDVVPITVPACSIHNGAFSKHEEYFRDFLLGSSYAHPDARRIWDEKTVRALRRSPKYRSMLARDVHDVEVKSASGVFLGEVSVLTADMYRINLVLRKIVSGLYYNDLGQVLGFPRMGVHQILTKEDSRASSVRWTRCRSDGSGTSRFDSERRRTFRARRWEGSAFSVTSCSSCTPILATVKKPTR